jgi:hypothetical protein
MEEENTGPCRRASSRTRKMAIKMSAALSSTDNRTQVPLFSSISQLFLFLIKGTILEIEFQLTRLINYLTRI